VCFNFSQVQTKIIKGQVGSKETQSVLLKEPFTVKWIRAVIVRVARLKLIFGPRDFKFGPWVANHGNITKK